jgi:hypothetical protein
MKKVRIAGLLFVGVAAVAVLSGATYNTWKHCLPVSVCNFPEPQIVAGVVSVDNFPGNTPENAVFVRGAESSPGQPIVQRLFGSGDFPVPEGKRLVIEFVSAQGATSDDGYYIPHIWAITGGVQGDYFVPVTTITIPPTNIYVGSQPMRVYADPGTTVTLSIEFLSPTRSLDSMVTISGYLEDMS